MNEEWIRKVSLQYEGPTFHRVEVWILPDLIERMEKVQEALKAKGLRDTVR